MERLLLVDKPAGPTSHDVVAGLRRDLKVKRAGHCGTLDPAATGLLLVLTGRATRLAEVFGDHEKVYRGTVRFGTATDTDDAEGKPVATRTGFALAEAELRAALADLAARTEQRPPTYSAVKLKGVPLYKLAREGRAPTNLPPRPVAIASLELVALRETEADVELRCSAGTYVRALARDLGELLGIPAHLSSLRRLASGPFRVDDASSPRELAAAEAPGLSVPEALATLPAARARDSYLVPLGHGAQPGPEDLDLEGPLPPAGAWVRLLAPDGALIALARVEGDAEPSLRLRRRLAD